MTDLKDFNINSDINPKKEIKKRFEVRVKNCYVLMDNKNNYVVDSIIAYRDDVSARNKIIEEKEVLEAKYGEYYES